MKKMLALFAFLGFLTLSTLSVSAQDDGDTDTSGQTIEMNENGGDDEGIVDNGTQDDNGTEPIEAEDEGPKGINNILKQKFIDGDPLWMTPVLVVLIIGLALCIERIITLNLSTTNSRRLLANLEARLEQGDVEGAKEVCRSTRGPVASIFYQGLDRTDEGIEIVEKSLISYGSVQTGVLEKGLVWISLCIALAPMLGFLGTVVGMILAFEDIALAGDINPTIVASGIGVALLTTAFGLVSAIILQVFYNYIISKIDSIVNTMEDASINFVDLLIRNNVVKG